MLSELEPSRELTGGAWWVAGRLGSFGLRYPLPPPATRHPPAQPVPYDTVPSSPTRRYTENQFDSEFINVLREVRPLAAAVNGQQKRAKWQIVEVAQSPNRQGDGGSV